MYWVKVNPSVLLRSGLPPSFYSNGIVPNGEEKEPVGALFIKCQFSKFKQKTFFVYYNK